MLEEDNSEIPFQLQVEVDHSCPVCEEPMELVSIDPVEDTATYYCKRCDQHWMRRLGE